MSILFISLIMGVQQCMVKGLFQKYCQKYFLLPYPFFRTFALAQALQPARANASKIEA